MRSRKSRRKQRSALLGSRSDTCVVQTRSQRSRAGLAPGHKLTTVGHCARLCGRTCSVLGCCFASHLGNLCTFATVLWSVRAHTQRYAHMHAVCRGLWLSRGARASRACDSACVLCDCSSYVRGWARAELGPSFEPCHVFGCFEQAMSHTNRLVVFVFSQSIVQKSRSDPPSPLVLSSPVGVACLSCYSVTACTVSCLVFVYLCVSKSITSLLTNPRNVLTYRTRRQTVQCVSCAYQFQ